MILFGDRILCEIQCEDGLLALYWKVWKINLKIFTIEFRMLIFLEYLEKVESLTTQLSLKKAWKA